MMQSGRNNSGCIMSQQGMTLLEILLALLILGMIMTMVSISLSGSVEALNATMDQGEIYHRAQVAMQRISEDLASTVLIEDGDFIGVNDGDKDSLQFTSTAHIVFNQQADNSGIALISYDVQEDPERTGELILTRSDKLLITSAGAKNDTVDKGEGFVLSDRLRSVNFTYLDGEGEEVEDWSTVRQDPNDKSNWKLPVAVSCTLDFWVDKESDTSIEFTTSVLLPIGLINAQNEKIKSTL